MTELPERFLPCLFDRRFGGRLAAADGFSEALANRVEPRRQVVGWTRRGDQNSGQAACLTAEGFPALPGARVVRRQPFGLGDERLQGDARLGELGAQFMPFSARGDRLSESLCQSVSLRAVADERQERSPLFFDRNQLIERIAAVERLDAGAERVARCDGFGAEPTNVGRLGRFALAARNGLLGGRAARVRTARRGAASVTASADHASVTRASSAAAADRSAMLATCSTASHMPLSRRRRSSSAARRAASAASIS